MTDHDVSVIVCDMSPLRLPMQWCKDVAAELKKLKVPIVQVRTCIPCCVILHVLECRSIAILVARHE